MSESDIELTENGFEILQGEINGEPILSRDAINQVRVFPFRVSILDTRSIHHFYIGKANPNSIFGKLHITPENSTGDTCLRYDTVSINA